MRAGADLRVLRAAVFAAACAILAAAGHVGADGLMPSPAALAAGWAVAFALAVPFAGRERRSVPALAAALAAGQLALHVLYCLGRHVPVAGAAGHGGHGSGDGGGSDTLALAARLLCNDHALALTEESAARIVGAAGLAPPSGAAHAAADVPAGPAGLGEAVASLASGRMLLGHLLAACAAAWLLRRGEAALWRLIRLSARVSRPFLRLVRALLRALHAPRPHPPVPGPPRHRHHRLPAPRGTVIAAAVTRRGPPRPAAHHLALAA